MNANTSLQIRHGDSTAIDAQVAVAEVRRQIYQDRHQLILFSCSAGYDLTELATALRAAFDTSVIIGCTTAGHPDLDGTSKGFLQAISLAGDISAHPFAVDLAAAESIVPVIAHETKRMMAMDPDLHSFGLLLVDGLSRKEEHLASLLYRQMPQVPTIGGSAGDGLAFKQTHVYVDGAFRTNAAVFTLFRTHLPLQTVRFAHFVPTDRTLVVTQSDTNTRVVYEINGEPAAQIYADLVGVSVEKLDTSVFSVNPLIFEMGGEQYVRSIARANPDQSLTLFCAIENGVVLNIGRAVDPAAMAVAAFQQVRHNIGEPALVIGCDCVMRSLEFESSGLRDTMDGIMKRNEVFSFSTYGEQFDGLHMNQTFTGVAIGRGDAAI